VAWACINFLRAKIHTAGFKQTDWGYSSSPILSFRQSGDVPRRIGDWPAGHLDALDLEVHAGIPTVGLLIALTPRYRCPSAGYVSRLLPPRSGLSRSDLVPWPQPAAHGIAASGRQLRVNRTVGGRGWHRRTCEGFRMTALCWRRGWRRGRRSLTRTRPCGKLGGLQNVFPVRYPVKIVSASC